MFTKQQKERLTECVELLETNQYPAGMSRTTLRSIERGEAQFCALGVLLDTVVKEDATLRWGDGYWDSDVIYQDDGPGETYRVYLPDMLESAFGLGPGLYEQVLQANDGVDDVAEAHREAAKVIRKMLEE